MKKKILTAFAKAPMIALYTALLVVLFLNLSTLASAEKIRRGGVVTSGYFCAIISSGSMEPTVFVNDLLLVKNEALYQAEDIITYVSPQGNLITHRVKEVLEQGYLTQGDANNIPDEKIVEQRVLGKVIFVVPRAGAVVKGIFSPGGISLLGCIFLVVVLVQKLKGAQNEDEQE